MQLYQTTSGDLKLTKDENTLLKEMVWLYLLQKHSIDILMMHVLGGVFLNSNDIILRINIKMSCIIILRTYIKEGRAWCKR